MKTLVSLALLLAVGLLSVNMPIRALECLDEQFSPKFDRDTVKHALAQVFKTGGLTQNHYLGNAFVIDAKHGLLLTAAHIAEQANPSDDYPKGEVVQLRFPGINSGKDLVPATVVSIFRHENRRIDNLQQGYYLDDVALLRLEDHESKLALQHLRLHMSQWHHGSFRQVEVLSYYNAANEAVSAMGNLTQASDPLDARKNLKCMVNITANTDFGDSGAPILNLEGFVVGIVVQAYVRGRTKHGKAMPSYCITEELTSALRAIDSEPARSLANSLRHASPEDTAEALMPAEHSDEEWSNPIIHYALAELGSALATSGGVDVTFAEKLHCPIFRAALERRIPLPESLEVGTIVRLAKSAAPLREPGDQLLREAHRLTREDKLVAAAATAEASSVLFAAEGIRTLGNVFPLSDAQQAKIRSGQFDLGKLSGNEYLAQTLKGYVDSAQLSRDIHRRLGYGEGRLASTDFGQAAAAVAIYASYGANRELYAQSWAALGKEAFDKEDYLGASQAYFAALDAGAKQSWVEESYKLAVKLEDETVAEYHTVGIDEWYQNYLELDRIRAFGATVSNDTKQVGSDVNEKLRGIQEGVWKMIGSVLY